MVGTRAPNSAMETRVDGLEVQLQGMGETLAEVSASLAALLVNRNVNRRGRSRRRRSIRDRSHRPEDDENSPESGQGEGSRQDSRNRGCGVGRKMEVPLFAGEDAYGWLIRLERYFKINHVAEVEKMEWVLVALEGKALNWYQWWEEQVSYPSWRTFKEAVIRLFQPGVAQNPYRPLLKVKQLGLVMEYREQFELISGPMKDLDREVLKGIFLNGLREELQDELKIQEYESLSELMDTTLVLEEINLAWRRGGFVMGDKSRYGEKGSMNYRTTPLLGWGGNKSGGDSSKGAGEERK